MVVLDVEGVLTPEIWIAVADATGSDVLRRTTKDEPDYTKLMASRIAEVNRRGLTLSDIQRVIATLDPLEGAKEFLDELRAQVQVILLSDTFEQFIAPLMARLSYPTILCHRLEVIDDRLVSFEPRIPDQKRQAVEAFRSLGYHVSAAGDSFNDLSMIDAADHGVLFRSPPAIAEMRSDLCALENYDDLLGALLSE